MVRLTLAALFVCAGLSFARIAIADVTLTSGALPISATTIPRCALVNISKKPVTNVFVSVVNTLTSPPSTTTAVCGTLAPDAVCVASGGDDTAGTVYCRITAHASAKSLRGTMMTVLGNGDVNATSEAR